MQNLAAGKRKFPILEKFRSRSEILSTPGKLQLSGWKLHLWIFVFNLLTHEAQDA